MRIYIFGAQGVGKTSLSKKFAKEHGYLQFSGSSIMMEICGVNSREELSLMDKETKLKIEAEKYIPFLENKKNIIVDGHGTLNQEQINFFDKIVYMSCDPEVILSRIQNEETRTDRTITLGSVLMDIEEHEKKKNEIENLIGKIACIDNSGSIETTENELLSAIGFVNNIENESQYWGGQEKVI